MIVNTPILNRTVLSARDFLRALFLLTGEKNEVCFGSDITGVYLSLSTGWMCINFELFSRVAPRLVSKLKNLMLRSFVRNFDVLSILE